MKKHVLTLLRITWMFVAVFIAQTSVQALKNDASFCSGLYCESNSDCEAPCFCDSLNFMCYNASQSQS